MILEKDKAEFIEFELYLPENELPLSVSS
jgi:hypothetical protein